jgi:hypothetical protein
MERDVPNSESHVDPTQRFSHHFPNQNGCDTMKYHEIGLHLPSFPHILNVGKRPHRLTPALMLWGFRAAVAFPEELAIHFTPHSPAKDGKGAIGPS